MLTKDEIAAVKTGLMLSTRIKVHQVGEKFAEGRKDGISAFAEALLKIIKEKDKGTVEIELIQGVEGGRLSIDNFRVCGNKPWGGGEAIIRWTARRKDVLRALNEKC